METMSVQGASAGTLTPRASKAVGHCVERPDPFRDVAGNGPGRTQSVPV
jgi:hypothetical protein